MSAHLKLDPSSGVLVARALCEKIAEYEANVLEQELKALGAQHQFKVVLDMEEVQMIASVGLGMLVQLNRAMKGGGGKLVLAAMNPNVRQIMKVTRLDTGLTIVATVNDGIDKLR